MSQPINITKRIGARVKIDLEKVQDRISGNLIEKISTDPRATVMDYKMTDGGGVGIVVKLADGTRNWFFENEIGRG